jgi:hypothetical protein
VVIKVLRNHAGNGVTQSNADRRSHRQRGDGLGRNGGFEVASRDGHRDRQQPHAESLKAPSYEEPGEVPRESGHHESDQNDRERDEDDASL